MTSAKLIIRSPGRADREVRLAGGASIGRAFDNSVRVDVDGISRYHAIIEQKADGFWLSDLGSRNGTAVNGVDVGAECRLEDGNLILLGGVTTMEVRLDAASAQDARSASQPPNPREESGKSQSGNALKVGLVIVCVVVIVFIAARLLLPAPSGVSGRKGNTGSAGAQTSLGAAQPSGADGKSEPTQVPDPQRPEPAKSETVSPPVETGSAPSDTGSEPGLLEVQSMAEGLSRQISGRGGQLFRREFVEQIMRVIPDYKGGVSSRARQYSYDIQAAFHDQALDPVFGLILAMSVSRFNNADAGIWRLVPSLVRTSGYLKPGEEDTALKDSKRSAQIVAAYLKNLQSLLGGKQNFMYTVAFYGDPPASVSDALTRLETIDPQATRRLDFWSMVDAKVVKPEQAERVVRFFAAGVVGENPQKFGLSGPPLSLLNP